MVNNNDKDTKEVFRNTSLYPILFCSIVLIIIGIILKVKEMTATWGFNIHNRTFTDSAKPFVNGVACIVIGAAMGAWPVFQLYKNWRKKRQDLEN